MTAERLDQLEARVAELEAREEIRRRLDAYADAIDTRDRAALEDCFTADVRFVVTADGTQRSGRAALCDYLAGLLGPMGPTVHASLGAVDITVELGCTGGDAARSTHKGLALHELAGQLQVAILTYEHTWRRRSGTWRISSRRIVPWLFSPLDDLLAHGWDRASLVPPTGPPPRLPWASSAWGRRFDRR